MSQPVCCPYCAYPIKTESVTLWDGRDYCRECVESVSPELYALAREGAPLEDILSRGDAGFWKFYSYMLKILMLAILMLVNFFLVGILILLAMGRGLARIEHFVLTISIFGGLSIVLLAIQGAVGAAALRSRLPRTLTVRSGKFLIIDPQSSTEFPLHQCEWHYGSAKADMCCLFTSLRKGIVIQTPKGPVACGFLPGAVERWRDFFSLSGVRLKRPRGCLKSLLLVAIGIALGLPLGIGVGYILTMLTNDPRWMGVLGTLGFFQGAIAIYVYGTATDEGAEAAKQRLDPKMFALRFFSLGILFCIPLQQWSIAMGCGLLNALFGVMLAKLSRRRIDAEARRRTDEMEADGRFDLP